jgi:hypothetical protein
VIEFCSEFDSTTAPPGSTAISRPNCVAIAAVVDLFTMISRRLSLPSVSSCGVRQTVASVTVEVATPRFGNAIAVAPIIP